MSSGGVPGTGDAAAPADGWTLLTASAEQTRRLGRLLAARLRGGDVVVLAGPLGAGKTTLVQGLAAGLGIAGPVTSPTFVLARAQQSARAGAPALVHVDAYRLGSALELDDLDLDAELEHAVVVVEWGEGLAERLSPDRVVVRLGRPEPGGLEGRAGGADGVGDGDDGDEPRLVDVTAVGERWHGVDLAGELAAELAGTDRVAAGGDLAAAGADQAGADQAGATRARARPSHGGTARAC